MKTIIASASKDHAKCNVSQVSGLGLVEMTRKRTRESIEHVLCEPCSLCNGRGSIKSSETICHEIFRELLRTDKAYDAKSYLILASQSVVDRILDEDSSALAEIQDALGKTVQFQVETLYSQEQFDVVLI